MGYLERIATCRRWQPHAYRPFIIDGVRHGWVRHELAKALSRFPDVLLVSDQAVAVSPDLDTPTARTKAFAGVIGDLQADGVLPGCRNELFAVKRRWDSEPVMLLDRSAIPHFGIRAYGVHMHGLTDTPDGPAIWVPRRAADRKLDPGKLDNTVAGGQPAGLSLLDNLVKECGEEAAIPPALARQARLTATLTYVCEHSDGLRDDVAFCYDLLLPPDFTPRNTDGEVESFELWPLARAAEVVRTSEQFKFNCALAMIDLLLRYGMIGPQDADFAAIRRDLYRPA